MFLSDDNIRTVNKSRQLINPINKDLYKIINKEKNGCFFRIQNMRNLSERTVIFSELRGINLEDILYMELHPERLLQETGKAIGSGSYKRDNRNALKLIQMSMRNHEINSNAACDTAHEYPRIGQSTR